MSDRRPWWIWRVHPSPPKRLEGVDLMLPWEYVKAPWNRLLKPSEVVGLQRFAPSREAPAYPYQIDVIEGLSTLMSWIVKTYGVPDGRSVSTWGPWGYARLPAGSSGLGSMEAMSLERMYWRPANAGDPQDDWDWTTRAPRSQRRDFLVTPPMFMFCELSWEEAGIEWGSRNHPYIPFYVQPEVFEAKGEIMMRSPAESIQWQLHGRDFHAGTGVKLPDDRGYELTAAGAQRVMAALDSFLERGTPDPRFLAPATRSRRRRKDADRSVPCATRTC